MYSWDNSSYHQGDCGVCNTWIHIFLLCDYILSVYRVHCYVDTCATAVTIYELC